MQNEGRSFGERQQHSLLLLEGHLAPSSVPRLMNGSLRESKQSFGLSFLVHCSVVVNTKFNQSETPEHQSMKSEKIKNKKKFSVQSLIYIKQPTPSCTTRTV